MEDRKLEAELLRRFEVAFPGSNPVMLAYDYGDQCAIGLYPYKRKDRKSGRDLTFQTLQFSIEPDQMASEKDRVHSALGLKQ
jgi:hypothetical protein